MPAPGSLLAGRYRLESRIAAGAVGEVWRAEDLVLGRPVAVKLLREGYAGHPLTPRYKPAAAPSGYAPARTPGGKPGRQHPELS
jgi:serine/threonine protein kinase